MDLDVGQSNVVMRLANHIWRNGRQASSNRVSARDDVIMRCRVAEIDFDYYRSWTDGTKYELISPKWSILWKEGETMQYVGSAKDILNDLTFVMLSGELYD